MLADIEIDGLPPREGSEFDIDIDPKVGESLQVGLDALGKVFGGLVGAIQDAVGPELMRGMEVASWLEQLTQCLDLIAEELQSGGNVPSAAVGQLAFFTAQLDETLAGSTLESQQVSLRQQFDRAQQALKNTEDDPASAATVLSEVAGYFKAAAASCVPLPRGSNQTSSD